jgi:hypothetical protein
VIVVNDDLLLGISKGRQHVCGESNVSFGAAQVQGGLATRIDGQQMLESRGDALAENVVLGLFADRPVRKEVEVAEIAGRLFTSRAAGIVPLRN